MQIEASVYKKLVAINKNGNFVNIPNMVIRKLKWKEEQDRKLTSNSVCIVCNYVFRDKTRGWSDKVGAICHPFEKTDIFPDKNKLHLFSESDFCDPIWMPGLKKCEEKENYKYEFFAFVIDQVQGVRCKGYHLLPMIAKAAKEFGVRGVVVDYYHVFPRPSYKKESKGSDGWATEKTRKRLKKFLDSHVLDIRRGIKIQSTITELMNKSRYVIFPNTKDASPRTIVETILRGKPCLVNKNIYGGWKYINEENGMFFDGAANLKELDSNYDYYYNEIKSSMKKMRESNFDSDNIINNHLSQYGFINTSRRLARIINKLEGKKKYSYVAYREFSDVLRKYCKK